MRNRTVIYRKIRETYKKCLRLQSEITYHRQSDGPGTPLFKELVKEYLKQVDIFELLVKEYRALNGKKEIEYYEREIQSFALFKHLINN